MDDSPSDSPEPSAQGTFATTPLAHVLQHAFEKELSGTFELSGKGGPAGTFLVVDGKPAKARTQVDHYLLRVMEQSGIMTPAQVHNWLPRLLMSEELHGEALVRQKVISQQQLEAGLRAQLMKQMQTIVELPGETVFKYYDLIDNLASWGGEATISVEPRALIWASLKNQPPWMHVHPALDRLSQVAIRLKKDTDLTTFGFDFGQRGAIDLLKRRPWRVEELLAAAPVPAETAQILVYCLMLTKSVDFVQAAEDDDIGDVAPREPVEKASEKVPTPRVEGEVVRDSWLVQEWEAERGTSPSNIVAVEVRAPVREDPRAEPEPPISEQPPATWNPEQDPAPSFARATPTYEDKPPPTPAWDVDSRPTPAAFPSVHPPTASMPPRSTARPGAPDLPPLAFATPLPPRPLQDHMSLTPVPPPLRDDGPITASPITSPANEQASARTTAAPPPDYSEPGYDVPPPSFVPPSAPPSDPAAPVYTRSTVQRMNAVTAEEVAAYIASQEKEHRSASVGPPPSRPLSDLPRPHTPAQFSPVGRGSLFRPATPATPGAAPRPNLPPPPFRIPRPPTPAMFPPTKSTSSMRAVIVPPEPVAKVPPAPVTTPSVGVKAPLPLMKTPALGVKKPDPHVKTLVSAVNKPAAQVIVVPTAKPTTGTSEGAAARLALGAAAKTSAGLGDKEASEERISAIAPLSARKTMEFAVDKALLDATSGPASTRETIELPPTPPAEAPPAMAPGSLSLDLDSPWDDGWDDVLSGPTPASTPAKGK